MIGHLPLLIGGFHSLAHSSSQKIESDTNQRSTEALAKDSMRYPPDMRG